MVEEFACGIIILPPPVQFGQGRQSGEFSFDVVNGAGAGEGLVQALGGGGQVAQAECCLAVESGGLDEVTFNAWTSPVPTRVVRAAAPRWVG